MKNTKGLLDQPTYKDDSFCLENQAPEDRVGPKYSNIVPITSWLRNGDATTKPGFDKGKR